MCIPPQTIGGRRVSLSWMALTAVFVAVGWWIFIYASIYSHEWRQGAPLRWYHAVPSACSTLALMCTWGARFYVTDDDEQTYDSSDSALLVSTHALFVMRLVAIVLLVCSAWGSAFIWAFRDWIEPAIDLSLAWALLAGQVAFGGALLARWRQLYVEYAMHRQGEFAMNDVYNNNQNGY